MNDDKGLTMGVTPQMTGKTVLITGGTGGIGRAAAIGLASMGARVGITGRDQVRAVRAAATIAHESYVRLGGDVFLHEVRKLRRHVAVHFVVARLGFGGGVEVEAGAASEVPVLVLAR
jgi:NAD(P)-dependent dehydrogenase (short-subunit alcohol dehydrogenase family)